jgi:hypothetical protein
MYDGSGEVIVENPIISSAAGDLTRRSEFYRTIDSLGRKASQWPDRRDENYHELTHNREAAIEALLNILKGNSFGNSGNPSASERLNAASVLDEVVLVSAKPYGHHSQGIHFELENVKLALKIVEAVRALLGDK